MNKARRKWLTDISDKLNDLAIELTSVAMEEEECYDNIPDSLNDTDKANEMYENIDEINDISYEVNNLVERLNELIAK